MRRRTNPGVGAQVAGVAVGAGVVSAVESGGRGG